MTKINGDRFPVRILVDRSTGNYWVPGDFVVAYIIQLLEGFGGVTCASSEVFQSLINIERVRVLQYVADYEAPSLARLDCQTFGRPSPTGLVVKYLALDMRDSVLGGNYLQQG